MCFSLRIEGLRLPLYKYYWYDWYVDSISDNIHYSAWVFHTVYIFKHIARWFLINLVVSCFVLHLEPHTPVPSSAIRSFCISPKFCSIPNVINFTTASTVTEKDVFQVQSIWSIIYVEEEQQWASKYQTRPLSTQIYFINHNQLLSKARKSIYPS